jgi:bifunctional non-homologous end joining protein LigD
MSLEKYKEKRTFNRTPEPTGGKAAGKKLLFVVQKHQASHLHYDFRLEMKGVLKSWAVPKGPSMNPEDRRLAQMVEDHPFDYKDFEGIIPGGNYGAGTVIIWDQGTYEPSEATGDKKHDEHLLMQSLYKGALKIKLKGKKLKGEFVLVHTKERGENSWLLAKLPDKYALTTDVSNKNKSVVSGLTIEQMAANKEARKWKSNRGSDGTLNKIDEKEQTANEKYHGKAKKQSVELKQLIAQLKKQLKGPKKAMLKDVEPMMATRIETPFNDPDWIFELKWDGYRSMAYMYNGKIDLRSRSNLYYNKNYPPVVDALKEWNINAVVDGEIVVLNEEGKPDFSALQNWTTTREGNLFYYLFDLLWLDGIDLQKQTLSRRREILQQLVPVNSLLRFSDGVEERGEDLYELAKKSNLEGIVAKKKSSHYQPAKRTKDWLKIPTEVRQEFVIGGWTESDGGRPFRTLLFGYFNDKGDFIYAGHAGGGYKDAEMKPILERLKKIEVKKKPFKGEVETDRRAHWVKPQLVAEIKYATTTKSGKIRKPAIFLGFREDKEPKEVKKEIPVIPVDVPVEESFEVAKAPRTNGKNGQHSSSHHLDTIEDSNWPEIEKQKITSKNVYNFGGHHVKLLNIEKPLWKGFPKGVLLAYYHTVADYILPHLADRPLSLHLKPNGPNAPGLYIKDMEGRTPDYAEVFTVPRKHKKKGKRDIIDYLVCNNEATLQYVINLGAIDLNPWTSRTIYPQNPDYIIVDLDPSDEDFSKAIEAAKASKEVFDKYKLKAFPKTSGKTGIHMYIPCKGFDFSQARSIAERICTEVEMLIPSTATTEVTINLRGNKIYLDPNQNDFADTVASAYSARPWHLPTVSTPLEWKEVNNKLDPHDYTISTILERIEKKGDLFIEVLSEKHRAYNSKILKNLL